MPIQIPDQSIAAQGVQSSPMTTIGTMLNMANSAQSLKKAKATFDADVAQRQAESSTAQSSADVNAANIQPLIQQQAANTQTSQANAQVAQGTVQPRIDTATAQAGTAQTGQAASKFALSKDYQNTALQTATGLLGDPRITAGTPSNPNQAYDDQAAVKALGESYDQMIAKGVPKEQALLAVSPFVNQVHTPGAVQGMLANTIKGMLPAPAQAAQGLVQAGQQQQTGTDQQGNPIVINRNQYGAGTNIAGAPVQGQGVTAPSIIPQGETPQSRDALIQQRQAVSNAAQAVPDQHLFNQNVIKLASDPTMLNPNNWEGKGAAYAAKLGIPAGTDYKTAMDTISHNLAMAAQANEKAMGVSTDAGRQTAALATGSISMTPQALANAAKMNDATSSGLSAYNMGKEAAIGQNNNVYAQRQFQNQWTSAYTPQVMMLHNAIQSGDRADVAKIINAVGGPGSAGALDLANRAKAIQSLVQTGSLPQGR